VPIPGPEPLEVYEDVVVPILVGGTADASFYPEAGGKMRLNIQVYTFADLIVFLVGCTIIPCLVARDDEIDGGESPTTRPPSNVE
jgi:hypothetical protein